MSATETWALIHEARASLVATATTLHDDQWDSPSWCEGWSVKEVMGHVVAAAEQTTFGFYAQLARAGFNFNTYAATGAKKNAEDSTTSLIERLAARTTTTNRPPAPVVAVLGEIVVHSDDIYRPLGIDVPANSQALEVVADNWKGSNLLIGAKRRISGLRLVATDSTWSTGEGPLVEGPLQSVVLAMVGRKGALVDLSGPGVDILAERP